MIKKIFLILLICYGITSCRSSYTKIGDKNANYIPYYLKVYEADSLHIAGNYKQSQYILDSLFKKFEPINQESYIEYITYLKNKILLNDFKNIDFVLKRAVKDYGFKVEYFTQDSLLNIGLKKTNFTEKDLNDFYSVYVENLNLEYRCAIEKMIENDQRVRVAVPKNNEEWKKVDRENANNIKMLIEEHGYPSDKKIGRYDFNNKSINLDILFLHATKEERENYILDLLLESVKKGECTPSDFATVYDKYLYVSGTTDGKVFYGELRDPKKSIDLVVLNPKKIDSIRKSIGLDHLEYKRWKLKKLTGLDINNL